MEIWVEEGKEIVNPRSGGCDLAIRMGLGEWPGVHVEPLMGDRIFPVCSPEFAGKLANPRNLGKFSVLHDDDPHAQWSRWLSRAGIDMTPALAKRFDRGSRFASSSLLLRAAAAGQGVALARERLAASWLESEKLVRPFPVSVELDHAYWLVTRHGIEPRRPLRIFIAWLKQQAGVLRKSRNPRQSQNRYFRDGLHAVDSGGNIIAKAPAPMMIGYARVSTEGQTLDQQRAALKAAGCKRVFEEKASGTQRGRPELAKMLDHLQPGNVVTVTRLDRLARSTRDLLDIAERIGQAEAGLRSLAEPWADTTTPAGRMVLTFFAGVAEFERSLIHERTSAGRAAAKAKGVRFGRPPALSAEQIAHARQLISEDKKPAEVARLLKVHRATLYRALNGAPMASESAAGAP